MSASVFSLWKQLRLENEHDELHVVGDTPEQEWLMDEVKKYVANAYVITHRLTIRMPQPQRLRACHTT